jgi:hypothetical protein
LRRFHILRDSQSNQHRSANNSFSVSSGNHTCDNPGISIGNCTYDNLCASNAFG